MNELQRQHYLSALGIDTYMPRWQLPFAPVSVKCELPAIEMIQAQTSESISPSISANLQSSSKISPANDETKHALSVNSVIGDILDTKKSIPKVQPAKPVSAADILAQLDSKPSKIDAFSLSIWRPLDGVMIVDSRNSKLALPTELLLNNILRSFFSNQGLKSQEEILRWPMIENSFTKRTVEDARDELQTWLSVQHEIRPIQYLWLMGCNAASYLLPAQTSYTDLLFHSTRVADSAINALILPSLNEVLQQPIIKRKLFAALRHYHSTSL